MSEHNNLSGELDLSKIESRGIDHSEESHSHHHHHHHSSQHSHSSHSESSSIRKKKKSKSKKRADKKSKHTYEPLLILATVLVTILFLIFAPDTVALSQKHFLNKWAAASFVLILSSVGQILYFFSSRMFESGKSKVRQIYTAFCQFVSFTGIIFLIIVSCVTASIGSDVIAEMTHGVTKSELEAYLDEYMLDNGASFSDKIVFNSTKDEIYLVNDAVIAAMNNDTTQSAENIFSVYRKKADRLDTAVPATVSFTLDSNVSKNAQYITAEVSKNKNFSDKQVIKLSSESRKVEIPYLETNTRYYLKINVICENEKTYSAATTFKTAYSPRVLTVSGINNVRDIGGMKTTDGKVIKQGMIIRGSEIDGAVEPTYRLTQDGINTLKNVFKIKTDMDLRQYNDGNPLNVTHLCYNAPMYEAAFKKGNMDRIKNIFADLSKSDNYPIYMHCTYGADRTGTVCYLLEMLLGVNEFDAELDYELTSLFRPGVTKAALINVTPYIEKYDGKNMQEKTENYLKDCGVTAHQIESIRNILLTDI